MAQQFGTILPLASFRCPQLSMDPVSMSSSTALLLSESSLTVSRGSSSIKSSALTVCNLVVIVF